MDRPERERKKRTYADGTTVHHCLIVGLDGG